AKVDTGARTSALHAEDVKIVRRGSKRFARFTVCPTQRSSKGKVQVRAPLVGERQVRSSNGEVETRPVVRTTIQCGADSWEIEITLTKRDVMGFRMLLGRQAIRGHAVVDPGRSYVAGKAPAKRRKSPTKAKKR
ncbi:MAG: RimK/LysX family protein, partial [Deltaproteobacteria bacterium]|nr:RimK/LysX family protein [Deltaproteobacteria bacterium]